MKNYFSSEALQTRIEIDVNNLFVAQVIPEIHLREKHMFQKQLDVFFCYSLYERFSNTPAVKSNFT